MQGMRTLSLCLGMAISATVIAIPRAPAQSLAPLTIQLDWKPTAQFAGILVAKQRGFYTAEGLDVNILSDDGTGKPTPAAIAAHANDPAPWIGIAEADLILDAYATGAPIKAFATMMQSSPFALLTLKNSNLTTIKSLKGKAIGVHNDGQKAIEVLLQFNGMTRTDITLQAIPYNFDALLSGKIAAMQGYIIDEPIQLQLQHHPVNIIPMSANGYTCYAEVLFAPTALLQSHPDKLARFLRATAKGWAWAATHPTETAQMIVTKYAPDHSAVEQKASLLAILPLLHTEDPRFGMMQPTTWAKSIHMFETYKLVDHKLSATDAVDFSILTRLYPPQRNHKALDATSAK